ncbi:hypothetical protein [Streptosporangium sp. NPDC087985]|uniref:hypothetical protein n=1 Tax=Streptosporangium sp. NPDC087985 TaxID=3366196 RepID=UPI0038101D6B
MAGWWRRARVVSAVGTGALILGGGPVVHAAGTDDSVTPPVGVAGAEDLNFWSQWVSTSDVVRFRVWLEGSGTDARLAVVTTPAEALKSVECPQEADAQAPVNGGAGMCSLGEVNTRSSVDVLLAMPETAADVELTAVARMRNSEGVWVTHTARTTVGNPASKATEVVEAAGPVLPQPAPGVPPWAPGITAGGVKAPQVVGEPEARAVPPDQHSKDPSQEKGMSMILEEPSTPGGSASIYEDHPAGPVEPELSGAPQSVKQSGPRGMARVPRGERTRAVVAGPSFSRVRAAAKRGRMSRLTGQVPRLPAPMPQMQQMPQVPQMPQMQQMPQVPEQMPQVPEQMPQTLQFPQAPQVPGQGPGQGQGQVPPVWNDPAVRMPQAAPAPAVPAPAVPPLYSAAEPQPPGAPLPRDLDGSSQEIMSIADSGPLLTGMRGLPVVGAGVGGLLGMLWLQMRAQRRREARPVL